MRPAVENADGRKVPESVKKSFMSKCLETGAVHDAGVVRVDCNASNGLRNLTSVNVVGRKRSAQRRKCGDKLPSEIVARAVEDGTSHAIVGSFYFHRQCARMSSGNIIGRHTMTPSEYLSYARGTIIVVSQQRRLMSTGRTRQRAAKPDASYARLDMALCRAK